MAAYGRIPRLGPTNSFAQAHRQYPDLIPYGSTERAAWTSAWTEELVTEQHWQRRLAGNGAKRVVVRVMVNGALVEGVPVPLAVLFGNQRLTSGATVTRTVCWGGDLGVVAPVSRDREGRHTAN